MNTKKLAAGAVSLALALSMVSTSAFATAVEFSDVPSNHWARPYIMSMVDKGIMSGVGGNRFAPSNTLTYAEFLTMITNRFYQDKLTGKGAYWYSPYMDAAKAAGILSGVDAVPTNNINRYEMAQVMYNVMRKQGVSTTPLSDTSKVGDWPSIPSKYKDAVSVCYNMGLLAGTDTSGTFSGDSMLDRAQGAVVMDKLDSVVDPDRPAPKPEPGKVPAGATHITKCEQLDRCDGMEEVPGGFHCTGAGMTYGSGGLAIVPGHHSTISFMVEAVTEDVCVKISKHLKGTGYFDPSVDVGTPLVVKKGTSHKFTFSVSDADRFGIGFAQVDPVDGLPWGCPSDCYITDIYLY